jgi:hypothetical protein
MSDVRFLAPMVAAWLACGCAMHVPIPNYAPDPQVRGHLSSATKLQVRVGTPAFADSGSILCRGGMPVKLPDGRTFSHYIGDALSQELALAGALDARNGATLDVRLTRVDFSTALGATNWYIDAQYTLSGQAFSISTTYNDRSSYFGDKACQNMAPYFQRAVSRHIGEVFRHPTFVATAPAPVRETPRAASDDKIGARARLEAIESLYKDGLMTKDEYETRRKQIIDGL